MKKHLCIIPARGGSKRIPRKNILPLNGIPLIAYTIRAALKSGVFDKVVLSTEDPEIASIGKSEGIEVDTRPKHMAGDRVTKVQVVEEYIHRNKAELDFENVSAMLPTCPFRTAEDVKNAIQLFDRNSDKDFMIGVVAYDFPIQLALKKKSDDEVEMVNTDGYSTTRSQNIEPRYHPNGAIYTAKISAFKKTKTFFNEHMLAYEMPAIRSFDIDYPYQFEIAEVIAQKLNNNE